MSHTDGPWRAVTYTVGNEICTMHNVPRRPTEDGLGQTWVYIVGQEPCLPTPQEQAANEALILGAPRLLAALKSMVEPYDRYSESDLAGFVRLGIEWGVSSWKAVLEARVAIREAESHEHLD